MKIIQQIKESWGWIGIEPEEVVGENDFGNLMIKDIYGKYWRLCPEDLYCQVIAEDRQRLDELSNDQDFLRDWYMASLVEQAETDLGELEEGKKYCLAIPSVLGGEYSISNIKTILLLELISFSGDMAKQIKDLPDGAQVQLDVAD